MKSASANSNHYNHLTSPPDHKLPVCVPHQPQTVYGRNPLDYQIEIDCIKSLIDNVVTPKTQQRPLISDSNYSQPQDVPIQNSASVFVTMQDPRQKFTSPARYVRQKDWVSPIKFNDSAKSKMFRQKSNKENQSSKDAKGKSKFVGKTSIKKQITPFKIEFECQLTRKKSNVAPFILSEMTENLPYSTTSTTQTVQPISTGQPQAHPQFTNYIQPKYPSETANSSSIQPSYEQKNYLRESLTQCNAPNNSILNRPKRSNATYYQRPANFSVEYPRKYIVQRKLSFKDVSLSSKRSHYLEDDWRMASPSTPLYKFAIQEQFDYKSIKKSLSLPSFSIKPKPKYEQVVYQKGSFKQQIQSFWLNQLQHPREESEVIGCPDSQEPKLRDFIVGKKLGKGMYGQVFIAQHKHTGFVCAMKVISRQFARAQNVSEQLIQQLKIHMFMDHPNIVGVYGFFCDLKNVYVLQQLCTSGQLYNILARRRRISEKKTAYYVRQMIHAMEYIHHNQVIHRDIKPENILLQFGVVKIGDFGWAEYSTTNQYVNKCGTPLYLSPEVVRGEKYTRTADNWGIGLICYQLIVGNIPWSIWTEDEIWRIAEESLSFPDFVDVSSVAQEFIQRTLTKHPKNRLSLRQMLNHAYLSKVHLMDYHNQMGGHFGEVTP